MLLQTNSYLVPADKQAEHARLMKRFRTALANLGCHRFEVYEQAGPGWSGGEKSGRFVQMMRFRDRREQQAVQAAERSDPTAQAIIAEFCELINFPYQQQQGLFASGFYTSTVDSPEVFEGDGDAEPHGQSEAHGEPEADNLPLADAGPAVPPHRAADPAP